MDGDWQMGHKTEEEYGRLAAETARAMRMISPDLKLVSCGSSHTGMPTFPEWEAKTLTHTYDVVDYISLHQYFDNEHADTADFLAKSLETDRFIKTVISVCDYVKAKKRGKKDIMLSFDEWNVWYHSKAKDDDTIKNNPWNAVPKLLEDVYTFEDALVIGCMLITFLKHADRLKMACMAQLVNVIAPIMTEVGGGICRQTTFYPFLHVSKYGRGSSLRSLVVSPKYDSKHFTDVPYIESAVVQDEITGELTLFAVNRNLEESIIVDFSIRGFEGYRLKEHIVLECDNLQAVNTPQNPHTVTPSIRNQSVSDLDDGRIEIELGKASWNVLRFCKLSDI
jgi:alpha-N-arabinofuranosidase